MRTVCIFDTSIVSRNVGDQIIMDSVQKIVDELFKNDLQVRVATHESLFIPSHLLIRRSDVKIVGGTNLLSSNMPFYNQWKVNLLDSLFIPDIVLLGVGWWQYQGKPNLYTKMLLNRLLSKKFIHSVRDDYTKKMLESIGIKNVVNTTCPTMWGLTRELCKKIPTNKAERVLFTLTSYNKKKHFDEQLIRLLQKNYSEVYFWPQQPDDLVYFRAFSKMQNVRVLPPNLMTLDKFLKNNNADYLGTRLHAGIRALSHHKRSLILGVDNRSLEIGKDTKLPVIKRENIESIKKWILSKSETSIILPEKNIKMWKNQFRQL